MEKKILRKILTTNCKTIEDEYKSNASRLLLSNLLPIIQDKQSIAVYHAYDWEISLQSVIKYCLVNRKYVFQPLASHAHKYMYFVPYDNVNTDIFASDAVYKQCYNCSEWYDLDIILLPLVGVDRCGNRLGKGGGYYDTTLSKIKNSYKKPILCGIGYHCQIVDKIPCDNWDIKLDYFVSELDVIKF